MSKQKARADAEMVSVCKDSMTKKGEDSSIELLCHSAITLIQQSREYILSQIHRTEAATYFLIGAWIVEVQQGGEERAKYGANIVQNLSDALTKEFGKGYSPETIKNIRKFYLVYRDKIGKPVVTLSEFRKGKPVVTILEELKFTLPWTHYLILMRIQDENARSFYEVEATKEGWSKRELKRQFDSALYERLALSKDKEKVVALAKKGQIVEKPADVVKEPYVLEFLGLKDISSYSETDLETRIINHLQEFLLELGKGFAFVGRQVRFTFDEEHFRVDLVFYNRLLRCFILFDLKIGKLKHQDLGQMQMYVNYYDRYEKTEDENPTVGILLCQEKSDKMVELTLPKDANIYAAQYQLYLPDKALLQKKLQEWIDEG